MLCTTFHNIDEARVFLEAIDAYLYLYERDYIEFLEVLGISGDVVGGELNEQLISTAVQDLFPELGEAAAGWIGVFIVAGLGSFESEHNAHVTLYHFRDTFEQALNAWEASGRDDLYMRVGIWNTWGSIGDTNYSMLVRSSAYWENPYGLTFDTVYYGFHEASGWGNEFRYLMEELMVTMNHENGFGFTRENMWGCEYYMEDGGTFFNWGCNH